MDPFQAASEMLAGGRHDLAETVVRRGLKGNPDSPFGHALLALCLHYKDDAEGAAREAREAVALSPDTAFCHYVLGLVLVEAKKVAEAETAALTALDLDPENESHLALLARVRLRQKRADEALELVLRGLRIDPNDLNCLNIRIVALRELGRNAEAQVASREILQRHPENQISQLQAGIARGMVRDDAAARAHFAEALRLDPGNTTLARVFEAPSRGFPLLWVVGAVFALVGAITPWARVALTGRCLRGLTFVLPLVALSAAWGYPRRLLVSAAAVASLLASAWMSMGSPTRARLALTAAAVAALVPVARRLRGV